MGQSRSNEVELATYLHDKKYSYFPIKGNQVGEAQSVETLKNKNIKIVNNGYRVYAHGGTEKPNILLVTNEKGDDILGEISPQWGISFVANYRYYSQQLKTTITKELCAVEAKAQKKEHGIPKKPKRKLAETKAQTHSPKKPFSNKIVSKNSAPRSTAIAKKKKAPAAQETTVVPTDIAATEQKIFTQDLYDKLRDTMEDLSKESQACSDDPTKDESHLEFLITSAAHLAVESYRDKLIELDNLIKIISPESTAEPFILANILLNKIQQILDKGKTLVEWAIALAHQDLRFYRQKKGMDRRIQKINENLEIFTNWLEIATAKQVPFHVEPPKTLNVPHGPPLPTTTPTTVTPPIPTGLTTPTTTTPPPSTALPLSAAPLTSPPSPRTSTLSYSGTLFSPPPYSPQLPALLEEENEEVGNDPPMSQEQMATVASYLR